MTTDEIRERLQSLYLEEYGEEAEISRINNGGSSREYYRLKGKGGPSVIGVWGEDIRENECFIRLDTWLRAEGINVPKMIRVSDDNSCYVVEDLGDVSLFSLLGNEKGLLLSKQALIDLLLFQFLPKENWEDKVGYKPFSERLVMWDLNYFKYDFLKPSGIQFDEEALEDDFVRLKNALIKGGETDGLMYRDFQSRNVMVKEGKLWFIDFQGARRGPLVYDAVSFIWQAKAPFTFEEREELKEYYLSYLIALGLDETKMRQQMEDMMIFRNLQVMGAYGFRGLIEGKRHFIESIPFAVKNLMYHKEKGRLEKYPELKKIADDLGKKYIKTERAIQPSGLVVYVYSFSYKKGYPEDISGNGGGFMFDCRAIHNPGRYEAYKHLTGKDIEVIEFLERTDEASEFVNRAISIVKPSVDRYIQRGFTSLQIGFGCTGGQHRSVYCAEQFSKRLKRMYPFVEIRLFHKEQEGK